MNIDKIYNSNELDSEDFLRLLLMDYLANYSLFENTLDYLLRTKLTIDSHLLFLLQNIKLETLWQSFTRGSNENFIEFEPEIENILDVNKVKYRKLRDSIAHSSATLIEQNTVVRFNKFLKIKKPKMSKVTYSETFEVKVEEILEMEEEIVTLLEKLRIKFT